MNKRAKISKAVAVLLALTIVLGIFAGCGKKQQYNGSYSDEEAQATKVMVIGDYDINMDEAMFYTLQYLYINKRASDSYSLAMEELDKINILATIRENKIIYDVALHNGVELSEADMAVVQEAVNNFKNIFGEELLKNYGLSDETITRIFVEQATGTKFENDIKNDMGKSINEDIAEAYKDYSFHTLYYMVFPIVEIDDENAPKLDENGNYIPVSDGEKAERYAQAISAVGDLRDGENYLSVANRCGVTAYSMERSGYVGAYNEEYNAALEGLKTGECTDVMETEVAYTVSYMISADDTELRDTYVYSLTSDYLTSEYDTLRTTWLQTIPVDPDGDMEGTVWKDVSLLSILEDIETAGVFGSASVAQ